MDIATLDPATYNSLTEETRHIVLLIPRYAEGGVVVVVTDWHYDIPVAWSVQQYQPCHTHKAGFEIWTLGTYEDIVEAIEHARKVSTYEDIVEAIEHARKVST